MNIKGSILKIYPFIKYCVVGVLTTFINVASLYIFVQYLHFSVLIATALAFFLASFNSFVLNKIWTFQNRSKNYRKLYIKFIVISLIGLLLTTILMDIQTGIFKIWYIYASLITSAIVLIWNFLANKFWTFRVHQQVSHVLENFKYDVSIIVPAYNEEHRIEKTLSLIHEYLQKRAFNAEIIVVNDGSHDKTVEVVHKVQKMVKNITLLDLEKNHGKGYSVKKGVAISQGKYVLFTDADNSTPIEELDKFLASVESEKVDIVIASRYVEGSRVEVHQSPLRIFIGRAGNFVIQLLLIEGIKDSQCGFKLFRSHVAKEIFFRQKVNRWGFDMEILAIAKLFNYKILEVPVRWVNSSESRIRPIRDGLKTLCELFYIKFNLLCGRYE